MPRGHAQLHAAVGVLGLVVVPVGAAGARSRRARRPAGRRCPSTEHSTSSPPTSPRRSPASRGRTPPRAPRPARPRPTTLAMPTEEPSRAGLTNTGVPSWASCARTPSGSSRHCASRTRRVAHLRDAGRGHDLLEDDLVHAQRRREHAGAHVGHVEQLEQALDRAVLAERAVQHREHGVGAQQAAARLQRAAPRRRASRRRRARSRTSTTSWPAAARPLAHGRGGAQRHVVLGGAPAAEDRDPHRRSGGAVGVCRRGRRGARRRGRAAASNLPTTIVTRDALLQLLAAGRRLVDDLAVLVGRVDLLLAPADLEARRLQRRGAPRRRSGPTTSGTSTCGGALATVIDTVSALGHLAAAPGVCESTVPGPRRRTRARWCSTLKPAFSSWSARPPRCRRPRRAPSPAPARVDDHEHDRLALLELAVLRRRGRDHPARTSPSSEYSSRESVLKPAFSSALLGVGPLVADHVGHGGLARPAGHDDRDRRALVAPLAGLRASGATRSFGTSAVITARC